MNSYAIDEITQLHHIEEDNLIKWSGTDDDTNVCSLTLKDKTIASNFVRMVEEFSKLSLHVARTETNKTVHMYSSIIKTEFVLPEIPASLTSQTPVNLKAKPFTNPPMSSLSKSVLAYTEATLSQSGMLNINEPMTSEIDIDTEPKPNINVLTIDTDDEVPLSPIVRSSTPTTECIDSYQEILKSSMSATNKGLIPNSACVVGMAENTGMMQNEQDSAMRKKPDNLQGISCSQQVDKYSL